MKPTIADRLDAILGTDPVPEVQVQTTGVGNDAPIVPMVTTSGNDERDFNDDFNVVRNSLYGLIDKGKDLTDAANYIAKERQDAKSIEAAAIAQREARDNALALLDIHQKKADAGRGAAKSGDTITQNNAVFIGTTGQLLKFTRDLDKSGFIQDTLKALEPGEPNIIDAKPEEGTPEGNK